MSDKVVEINKPEDWTAATSIVEKCWIPTVQGRKEFELHAISYAEENEIRDETKDPDTPTVKRGRQVVNNLEDPEYIKAMANVRFRRHISKIDKSWATIPGENLDEKVEWARENLLREGEILNLIVEIDDLSGYGEVEESEEDEKDNDSVLMTKPEDWAKASRAPVVFDIKRNGVVLRFKFSGISGERTKDIEVSCDPGSPPLEPIRGKDGRRSNPTPNPNNWRYKQKIRQMEQTERMLFIEAALPFNFPGATMKDKLEWLGKRPAGEVLKLYRFARIENLSYKDKTDFTLGL